MPLHFKVSGRGEAVILLHGLLGSSDNWQPIAAALAERFRVFAVDQRNHGLSFHSADMDPALMAGDVADFMAEQGLARARVIGHSMGGKVAMQLALQQPERVAKLVVEDMTPRADQSTFGRLLAALQALDLAQFQNRPQMEDALAPAIPSLTVRRFLLKNLRRDERGGFQWKIGLAEIAANYPRLCAALPPAAPFTRPALFLRGGQSDYLTAADEPEILRRFPAARIETIAGAGHWIHADAPAEFLRRVQAFL